MTGISYMSVRNSDAPPWVSVPEPNTIDDVLDGIDQVLDWSVNARSNIGYFAVNTEPA